MSNGWINRSANAITRSGVRLGPLDAVFAGLDYFDGKAQGEDDIRAAAGATGSTLGGWGGAAAGATAGMALGPIGAAAGAIIGGTIGGFAGGWGADRADELVRGNKGVNKMASFNQGMYDQYGNPVQPKPNDGWGWDDTFATGAGLYAGNQIFNNGVRGNNPIQQFRTATQGGIPRGTAAKAVAKQTGQNIARGIRNMPLVGKAAGLYAVNHLVGNPIGGVADAITGNNFDFDGKGKPAPSNTANAQRDQREVNQAYNIPNYDMPMSPQDEANFAGARENYTFNRNNAVARDVMREKDERYRRRRAMELRAEQARDLTVAFSQSIPNSVANQIQAIYAGGIN